MKLLANRFYGYQSLDLRQQTVANCLSDKKKHVAEKIRLFKELNLVKNA